MAELSSSSALCYSDFVLKYLNIQTGIQILSMTMKVNRAQVAIMYCECNYHQRHTEGNLSQSKKDAAMLRKRRRLKFNSLVATETNLYTKRLFLSTSKSFFSKTIFLLKV